MKPQSQLGANFFDQSFNVRYSSWVHDVLDEMAESFTITDPSIEGHPIVFASKGFLKMTGYSLNEVIGKNGRIFQGPRTSRRSVMEIREAITEERAKEISIVNYKKDGTPFWMLLHLCPVFGKEDGRVTNFVGVQIPVLKKRKLSSVGLRRNKFCLYVNDSCRREVFSNSFAELGRVMAMDLALASNNREIEIENCEASDLEKRKATTVINNIFSVLSHYSELTGKLVCSKRCCISDMAILSSSLNVPLDRIKQSFVLTNPQLPGMPIVYASDAFLKLTGYPRNEVLGRNCRFLSGLDADLSTILKIKNCIKNEKPCTVRILNYRKDKSPFWNLLHLSPVRNASGKIAYYVEAQMNEIAKNEDENGLSPEIRQRSIVGAVKVAIRSMSMTMATTSKS